MSCRTLINATRYALATGTDSRAGRNTNRDQQPPKVPFPTGEVIVLAVGAVIVIAALVYACVP